MAQHKQEEIRATKLAYWEPIIKAWQVSGQNASLYCKENKLNIDQFRYWQYQLAPATKRLTAKSTQSFSFVDVTPKANAAQVASFELHLPSGYLLSVPNNFNEDSLVRLLKILG